MSWRPAAAGPGPTVRWSTWGSRPAHVVLALTSAVLGLLSLTGRIAPLQDGDDGSDTAFRGPDLFGVALVLAGSVAVLTAFRWPLLSLLLVDVCSIALHAAGYVPPPLPIAELVVLYAVAATVRVVLSVVAATLTALSVVAVDVLRDVSLDDDKLVAYLLVLLAAWMAGYLVQVSRAQTRAVEENARLVAAQQEAQTQVAVREEKERLTRELHDVVAHGLGVMVALAAAARVAARGGGADPLQALATIESTGRSALAEMRTLIRDRDGDDAPSAPLLTHDGLAALAERATAAGLSVELDVHGTPRRLPPGVDRAAYRLVQESLTNTLRHASASRAQVSIRYQPETIDIRVHDDGRGLPRRRRTDVATDGYGHQGMRRRVDLLGGTFEAHQGPDGFDVVATIPTREEPS